MQLESFTVRPSFRITCEIFFFPVHKKETEPKGSSKKTYSKCEREGGLTVSPCAGQARGCGVSGQGRQQRPLEVPLLLLVTPAAQSPSVPAPTVHALPVASVRGSVCPRPPPPVLRGRKLSLLVISGLSEQLLLR